MKCKSPITKNGLKIPCGCCVACRINETTDWTIRSVFELHAHETASFVTLTYNEENYPKNGSISKMFLQEFYDELQHKYKYRTGKTLRFFSCGEYGDHTHRAHYHGIIYGLNPDPFDKKNKDRELIADSWHYCNKEMFNWNQRDFNKNAINFVSRETCQYVAGYVQKKLKSFRAEEYKKLGIEAPFKIQSKGLGLQYALDNAEQLRENGFTYYNGKRVRIPRYFREKLGIEKIFEETEEDEKILLVKSHLYDKEIQAHYNSMMLKFHNWLNNKGLPADKIDNIQYLQLKERLFDYWYEMQQAELAKIAENEFLKRRAMTKGVL